MAKDLWIRDAAHDYIVFEAEDASLIRKLLKCREVQRLRRVKQLGFSYVTYPGAEHTRFAHALGTAYVARLVVDALDAAGLRVGEGLRAAMLSGALLHDIGHLPFSHATEAALDTPVLGSRKHADRAVQLITGDTEVKSSLQSIGRKLPGVVARLLTSGPGLTAKEQVLHGLIDGNFDVDRLDFLLRDSVQTGVRTGLVDIRRLVRGLEFHEEKIVVAWKNLPTVEEFLLARHFMYEKVYFHKTTRGMEAVYRGWLRRACDQMASLPHEVQESRTGSLLRGALSLEQFSLLDDTDIISSVKLTTERGGDRILKTLGRWLLWRMPLKVVADGEEPDIDPQTHRKAMDYLDSHGFESQYFYHRDVSSDVPYNLQPYWQDPQREDVTRIDILVRGVPQDISSVSHLAHALMQKTRHVRVYAPHCRRREVEKILRTSQS